MIVRNNETEPVIINEVDKLKNEFEKWSACYIEFCSDVTEDIDKLQKSQEFNITLFAKIAKSLATQSANSQALLKMCQDTLEQLECNHEEIKRDYVRKPVLSGKERSIIKIGTITTYSTKRYCRLSKWLYRRLFGIVIEDLTKIDEPFESEYHELKYYNDSW